MARTTRWETRRVQCPEGKREAELFIEWGEERGTAVVKSVSCDNPRLADLDNWDCHWSCWEKITSEID
jgi:hypothetical protein